MYQLLKPYNADFDGDEMNMHVPQSLQTRVELEKLTYVPKQIISPRVHTPVIGLFQDSMLGLNRITKDGVFLTKTEMMNVLMYIPSFTGKLPKPLRLILLVGVEDSLFHSQSPRVLI